MRPLVYLGGYLIGSHLIVVIIFAWINVSILRINCAVIY